MSTILLLENDEDLRDLYNWWLEEAGYTVVKMMRGQDALRTAIRNMPDLIVADIMMPGIDGAEFVKRLRISDKRMAPVIFVTGMAPDRARAQVRETGAARVSVLCKPITKEALITEVKRVLAFQSPQTT